MAQRNTNKAPAQINKTGGKDPAETQAAASAVGMMNEATAEIIDFTPGKGKRASLMASVASENAQNALRKVQALQVAKQRLAEAQDLYSASSDKSSEATEILKDAGMQLYQGRIDGVLSDDEINSALGDVFGYKVAGKLQAGATPTTAGVPKDYSKDGQKASKTPFGAGEGLRKRIVRLVKAHEYVTEGDGGAFFEGLPSDEIEDILDNLDGENGYGLYGAYERLAKVRKDHLVKVDPAFDPKRIASLADSLANDVSVSAEMFATNPALLAAYTALVEIIASVDTAAASYEAEAA